MRRALLLCTILFVCGLPALAQQRSEPDYCYPGSGAYIAANVSPLTVVSYAVYSDAFAEFQGCSSTGFRWSDNYALTGTHRITQTSFSIAASEQVSAGWYGSYIWWSGNLMSGGSPGACFTGYIDVSEKLTGASQGAGTSQTCLPKPTTCPSSVRPRVGPFDTVDCDSLDFTNWSDPIVIALGNASYRFTDASSGVRFDLDGDHVAELTAWTHGSEEVAFLAVDRNGDGMINDASELFGNKTSTAKNGFLALAAYDANNDGVVDARDPAWNALLLWVDRNHNGISESSELSRIADSPVRSLDLGYHYTGRRDPAGNLFVNAGHALFDNGERPIYDVWLTRINPSTQQ